MPDKYVFTYQGDGDLAAIGIAETLHAINRGENILIVFMNNAVYGMTSGQMAPTSLMGMKTTTTPYGRTADMYGAPIKVAELIAQLPGSFYVTRQAVNSANGVRRTKKRCSMHSNTSSCIRERASLKLSAIVRLTGR